MMNITNPRTQDKSRPEPGSVHPNSIACGLVFCHNEEHILVECLEYYLAQGIDLVVVDNDSTDSSPVIAERMRKHGNRQWGRMREVVRVKTEGYEWQTILRLACEYMHEHLSSYDWILLIDADAFYQSPVRGINLLEFLQTVAHRGYNIVDAEVYEFYPTEKDDPVIKSHVRRLKYCDPHSLFSLDYQHKGFRYHESINFYTSYGHRCICHTPRVFPIPMIYRHYNWVSLDHGLRKVFVDRKPRYVERNRDPSLHWHHLHLLPIEQDLVKRAADLWLYDEQAVQVSFKRFRWIQRLGALARLGARIRKPAKRVVRRLGTRIRVFRESQHPWSFVARIALENLAYRCFAMLHRRHPALLRGLLALTPRNVQARSALDRACAFHAHPRVRSASPGTSASSFGMVRARDLLRQSVAPPGLPKAIHLLLTNFCNARCIFCNQNFGPGKNAQLTLEAFKCMADHIPPYLGCEFVFSGGGEPLLCRDLISIVRFTRENFPWVRTTLCTNGTLLSGQAEELAQTHLDRIDISVHSATSEGNSRLLQMSDQEDLFEGIELLKRRLQAAESRTKIGFRPAVSRLNVDEVPALVRRAASLGIDKVEVNFMRYYPWDSYKGRHGKRSAAAESLYHDPRRYNDVMLKSRRLAKSLGIRFSHEPLFGGGFKARPCPAPWMIMLVNFDGAVYPCTGGEIWFGKKVRSGQYRFGNLLDQHLVDVWNSDGFVAIRRTCSPGNEVFVPECVRCNNLAFFKGPDSEEAHIIKEPYPGWEA